MGRGSSRADPHGLIKRCGSLELIERPVVTEVARGAMGPLSMIPRAVSGPQRRIALRPFSRENRALR